MFVLFPSCFARLTLSRIDWYQGDSEFEETSAPGPCIQRCTGDEAGTLDASSPFPNIIKKEYDKL